MKQKTDAQWLANPIIKCLMERDGYNLEDARELFEEAQDCLEEDFSNAEELLLEYFELEPDFIFDFVDF